MLQGRQHANRPPRPQARALLLPPHVGYGPVRSLSSWAAPCRLSRRLPYPMSEESAIVAAPVQDFEDAFQARVVRDASTSPAAFSRTMPSPPKQRTNSRPPSAPLTSQWASANSLAWVQSTTKAKPFWASQSRPREVA